METVVILLKIISQKAGLALALIVFIILLTRIIGLRSLAKFTVYDFVFTLAIGSIMGAIMLQSVPFVEGAVSIGIILVMSFLFSVIHKKLKSIRKVMANSPLLLMKNGKFLTKNMSYARVSKAQLQAKLREANVLNYQQIFAVILESTGDISVLHKSGSDENVEFDERLIEGVLE